MQNKRLRNERMLNKCLMVYAETQGVYTETHIQGNTQTHTYRKHSNKAENLAEFIFGIHHPKTLQNKCLQHLCIFCMLPLKTVRLYKSEIAFIFIFVEEIFEEVVNLKKICST